MKIDGIRVVMVSEWSRGMLASSFRSNDDQFESYSLP